MATLTQIQMEAHALMREHGLTGWRFKFDAARKRGGLCSHSEKTISLSRYLAPAWGDAEVRDVILHEIAHALVGPGMGHGVVWQRKLLSIGGTGSRTHKNATVPGRYVAVCDHCGVEVGRRHRLNASMRRAAIHKECKNRVRWVDTGVAHRVS